MPKIIPPVQIELIIYNFFNAITFWCKNIFICILKQKLIFYDIFLFSEKNKDVITDKNQLIDFHKLQIQ
jgi:hypothetical protein